MDVLQFSDSGCLIDFALCLCEPDNFTVNFVAAGDSNQRFVFVHHRNNVRENFSENFTIYKIKSRRTKNSKDK